MTPDHDLLQKAYFSVWRDLPDASSMLQAVPLDHAFANARRLLHVACWFDRPHLVASMLQQGAQSDVVDDFGTTPLLLSIENGSFPSFKTMVTFLPSILTRQQGCPALYPLHALVRKNFLPWAAWAYEEGFFSKHDLTVLSLDGVSPLQQAHDQGSKKFHQWLSARVMS